MVQKDDRRVLLYGVKQNFEEEMAGLPGCYGPPCGAILIAAVRTDAGIQDAGAVAVRPLPQKGSSQQSNDPGGTGWGTGCRP